MSTRQWLWSLRLGAMALLLSFSATSAEPAKQINSDACMKCHKRNGQMLGHHGQDAMKMTCSSCHGEKGDHPKKPNDLVVFGLNEASEAAVQLKVCQNAICQPNSAPKSGRIMCMPKKWPVPLAINYIAQPILWQR